MQGSLERRVEEGTGELAEALKAANAESAAKSEFLATMSHELRTPLNAIIGFSDVIIGKMFGPISDDKYVDYAEDINNSGKALLGHVDDILDLSKIEAGKSELSEVTVDVAWIVEICIAELREQAEAGGIEIEREISAELPGLIANERKCKQILFNLMSNAVKFTLSGGRVTVKVWPRLGNGYVFQIADTGIGIALQDIPKTLAPFHQVDGNLNRSYEGTGLGLPLAKSFIELHGGSLDLQSELGAGTTVTVRFPAERIAVAELPEADESISA